METGSSRFNNSEQLLSSYDVVELLLLSFKPFFSSQTPLLQNTPDPHIPLLIGTFSFTKIICFKDTPS